MAMAVITPAHSTHAVRRIALMSRYNMPTIATQAPVALILSPLLTGGKVFDK